MTGIINFLLFDQGELFNGTIVNIMYNFIPNETTIFGERDPTWLNKNIKNMINVNVTFKKFFHHNESHLELHLRYFQGFLNKYKN